MFSANFRTGIWLSGKHENFHRGERQKNRSLSVVILIAFESKDYQKFPKKTKNTKNRKQSTAKIKNIRNFVRQCVLHSP